MKLSWINSIYLNKLQRKTPSARDLRGQRRRTICGPSQATNISVEWRGSTYFPLEYDAISDAGQRYCRREQERGVFALRRGLSSRFAAVNDVVTPSIHMLQRGKAESQPIAAISASSRIVNHKIKRFVKRFVQRATRGLNQALRQVILRKVYMMLAQVWIFLALVWRCWKR